LNADFCPHRLILSRTSIGDLPPSPCISSVAALRGTELIPRTGLIEVKPSFAVRAWPRAWINPAHQREAELVGQI
jgi:hypothetical protein